MDMMYIKSSYATYRRVASVAVVAIVAVLFVKPVQALGIGAAVPESYIGEVFSVRIPLFSVERPDSLAVKVETSNFVDLVSEIDRSNSQLAIRVRSQQVMNEPYLNFALKLIDNGNSFSKEFVVLLDLSPPGRILTTTVQGNSNNSNNTSNISGSNKNNNNSSNSLEVGNTFALSDVMGPYEWAEQGRVAKKFGAVLDGQSLWRVARRINKALGVSLNQMIWGLYQANPQAFSGRSISTLRAGEFLNIPTAAEVSAFSDAQARAQLNSLEGEVVIASSASSSETSSDQNNANDLSADNQSPSLEQAPSNEKPVSDQTESPFQLTTIDQVAQSSQSSGLTADQKSQEIISSLAQTVGDLTQELIRKDKKIAFLEEKVQALRGLERVDNAALLEAANVDASFASEVSSDTVVAVRNDVESQGWLQRWWLILLGALALICALFFVFRERLLALYDSLNLFGSSRGLEFEQSHIEYDEDGQSFELERNDQTNQPIVDAFNMGSQGMDLGKGVSFSDFKGYIDLESADNQEKTEIHDFDNEMYEDLEEDQEEEFEELESEMPLEYESGVESDVETDLSFSKQFNKLLESKNYEQARELLDGARYNEIEEGVYHCERLQILYNKKNVDGFYNYFYSIESKIQSFDKSSQTRISQMLVSLWS